MKLGAILCSVNEGGRSGTFLDENNKTLEMSAEVRSHQRCPTSLPALMDTNHFLSKSYKQNPKSPEPKSSDQDLFQHTIKFHFIPNKCRGTITQMKTIGEC